MKRIVLSAPGKNALSIAVLEGVRRDVEATGGEPFLLTGAGDTFCAGLNLKEVATLDGAGMRRLLGALDAAVEAIFHHPAPTVACVNGHAIAGGCVLAMCCDLVVAGAEPRIRIGLNETALGLPFPPRILAMVRSRVPPGAVDRVVLEAGLHAPAEARALGLVDEVADDARGVAVASADPGIRIGLNETALGLPFPPRVTALARHRLAPGAVERALLGAGLYPPAEARALGFVDRVADDAAAVAEQELARLAAHPRAAYAANKAQLRAGALVNATTDAVFEQILPLWDSDETRRRAAAALKAR